MQGTYKRVSLMIFFPEVMKDVHNLKLHQTEEKHKETKLGVLRSTIGITAPSA